jgi:hypothetical protein
MDAGLFTNQGGSMKNLQNLGLEVLTAEEMKTIRGGYQLIWDFGDRPKKEKDGSQVAGDVVSIPTY